MSSGRVSHAHPPVSKHSTKSLVSEDILLSPVKRTSLHPPQVVKKYRSSKERDAFRSPVSRKTAQAPQTAQKSRSSVPENVLTSSVKRMTHSHPQKNVAPPVKRKTAPSSKSAHLPLARLSKKRVYNQANTKPVYFPYGQCTCDLEEHSNGEDKLSRAECCGKAMYVLDHDGTRVISCAHLRDCVRFVVRRPIEYDPATIVTDFLRATGSHPRLPALNHYWNKKLANELQAISDIKSS